MRCPTSGYVISAYVASGFQRGTRATAAPAAAGRGGAAFRPWRIASASGMGSGAITSAPTESPVAMRMRHRHGPGRATVLVSAITPSSIGSDDTMSPWPALRRATATSGSRDPPSVTNATFSGAPPSEGGVEAPVRESSPEK
jgi:hypothetical protein